MHYNINKEVVTNTLNEVAGIFFESDKYNFTFEMKEFCLITNLQFGDYNPNTLSDDEFRSLVFLMFLVSDLVSLENVKVIFDKFLDKLLDEDVV